MKNYLTKRKAISFLPYYIGLIVLFCSIFSLKAQVIYYDSYQGNAIYSSTLGGNVTVFASGLNSSEGLVADSSGNLYDADFYTGNIYKFNSSGTETFFSNIGGGYPAPLVFDNNTDTLYAGTYLGDIVKIDSNGLQTTLASGLGNVWVMAMDSNQNIYESTEGSTVVKITPQGVESTFISGLGSVTGLAFNSSGDLFVSDLGNHSIFEYSAQGTLMGTFASGVYPGALTFDAAGDLFDNSHQNEIFEYTSSGVITFDDQIGGGYITYAVPEPSTNTLLLVGLGTLMLLFRYRKQPSWGC